MELQVNQKKTCSRFESRSSIFSNYQIAELSNCQIVELPNCPIPNQHINSACADSIFYSAC